MERSATTDSEPNSRRTAIGDAAIELLAEGGTRALTHRMVDRRLGIPEGSTSSYHRTREDLVRATVRRMVERELAAIESTEAAFPEGADAAEIIAALVENAGSAERRQQTLARYVLFPEAAGNSEVARTLQESRAAFLAASAELLRMSGAQDPELGARSLTAFINGLIISQVVLPEPVLSPEQLRDAIRRFLDSY